MFIVLKLPKGTKLPVIKYRWSRERDGSIEAIYTRDELKLCMAVLEASERERAKRAKL